MLKRGITIREWVSVILLLCCVGAIATLVIADASAHYVYGVVHQHLAAIPLILVGVSFICLQIGVIQTKIEFAKAFLLGLAFVLWGAEQLLPITKWTTIMDTLVVVIFVDDLGVVIAQSVFRTDRSSQ